MNYPVQTRPKRAVRVKPQQQPVEISDPRQLGYDPDEYKTNFGKYVKVKLGKNNKKDERMKDRLVLSDGGVLGDQGARDNRERSGQDGETPVSKILKFLTRKFVALGEYFSSSDKITETCAGIVDTLTYQPGKLKAERLSAVSVPIPSLFGASFSAVV